MTQHYSILPLAFSQFVRKVISKFLIPILLSSKADFHFDIINSSSHDIHTNEMEGSWK